MSAKNAHYILTTDRLSGTPFSQEDTIELCQLHQDARVMATLGGIRTDDQTQAFLNEKIIHWNQHGFGYWMFRDQRDNTFVGRGGIQHVEIDRTQEIEIGYTIRFERWRQGFATEIAQALLKCCFGQLGLDNIICFTLSTNFASQAVMQKVGFQFERELNYCGESHVLYRTIKQAR